MVLVELGGNMQGVGCSHGPPIAVSVESNGGRITLGPETSWRALRSTLCQGEERKQGALVTGLGLGSQTDYPCIAMWSVRTMTRIRTSPSRRLGYVSTPRYFFAMASMCSSAPSVVTSITVPRKATTLYWSSGSMTDTATRWSRSKLRALIRPWAVLKTTSSPSRSTQRGVSCGDPSGLRVASEASTGRDMRSRALVDKVSGMSIPSAIELAIRSLENIGALQR